LGGKSQIRDCETRKERETRKKEDGPTGNLGARPRQVFVGKVKQLSEKILELMERGNGPQKREVQTKAIRTRKRGNLTEKNHRGYEGRGAGRGNLQKSIKDRIRIGEKGSPGENG